MSTHGNDSGPQTMPTMPDHYLPMSLLLSFAPSLLSLISLVLSLAPSLSRALSLSFAPSFAPPLSLFRSLYLSLSLPLFSLSLACFLFVSILSLMAWLWAFLAGRSGIWHGWGDALGAWLTSS